MARLLPCTTVGSVRSVLCCVTAIGGLALTQPAAAQSDAQIQSIEREIRGLQQQLSQIKADLAARDRALKEAQEQARAARADAAAASARAAGMPPPGTVPAQAATNITQLAEKPLPKGAFQVGKLTVTLGGFFALEGAFRSRNKAASVATSFNGIPLPNSPNFHIPEYRETAQQSRFSLLTEARLDAAETLTGYLETDFLSAGSSSNSNESNSYTLRLRQFWGSYDNTE